MQEKIKHIIFAALKDLADELESEELANPTLETGIYGLEGNLDSIALVSLIADLEERLRDELGVSLVLADSRAMSAKNSPFKNAATLLEYIQNLLQNPAPTQP